jgi:glutamate N-acetyltransferase/amino-acid N-acetyltransferase
MKEGKYGLALIEASGPSAGVFTRNLVRAAPVTLMTERMKNGHLDGIIVNSGCANAYTGRRGYQDAISMASIGAEVLGVREEHIGVASTGVIGRYLDLDRIRRQALELAPTLERSESTEAASARAIMTTDLVEKHVLIRREGFSVGGIAKGSGMIAPNMGTMLGFLYTDAAVEAPVLHEILQDAARRSFNRVVVDGDTSTNDALFCTATGEAGRTDRKELVQALEEACVILARMIARDGEGATKLIEIVVTQAPSEEEAAVVARTVAASPLVKTAVYGEDPNWGRVVAAAGRAGVDFDPDQVSLWISGEGGRAHLVDSGEIVADITAAKAVMHGDTVRFELALKAGAGTATAWGCDLTEAYVEINGKYTT